MEERRGNGRDPQRSASAQESPQAQDLENVAGKLFISEAKITHWFFALPGQQTCQLRRRIVQVWMKRGEKRREFLLRYFSPRQGGNDQPARSCLVPVRFGRLVDLC